MADFINSFWNIYVIVLVVLSIAGCGILLWVQSKVQIVVPKGEKVGTTGHSFDGLEELNNPMPRWWMWLFYITIVFAFAYLALYPGLGTYAGKLGWKSSGEYEAELNEGSAHVGRSALIDLVAKKPA